MSTDCLPRAIPLRRPWLWWQLKESMERMRSLARRIGAWRARRTALRHSAEAERELARLSVRTLEDIGAPERLIGQRRWQQDDAQGHWTYWLNTRG